MPSFKVLNQSDARPWHFQELLKSNGRWRVAIFTGNILTPSQKKKIWALGDKLAAQDSFIRKYTPTGKSISSVIEVLAVHSVPRTEVDLFSFPRSFVRFRRLLASITRKSLSTMSPTMKAMGTRTRSMVLIRKRGVQSFCGRTSMLAGSVRLTTTR